MTMKQTKPKRKISFGQLAGVVVVQTMNIDGKTFAFWDEDGRYLSTVDRINCYEDAAKKWFSEWFVIRPNHQVKIMSFNNGPNAKTFIIQIKPRS